MYVYGPVTLTLPTNKYVRGSPLFNYFPYGDTYIWVLSSLVCFQEQIWKWLVFEWDSTMYTKYENHSRLNCQHNQRDLYESWPFHEHESLYFEDEYDIHMNFENYKESGYNLDLDLLTILS